MTEKSKLYVFEKKEVALIFVFMLLIAITSFMLGVKIGKSYSYQSSGLTEEDREKVELLSTQEENVNKVIQEGKTEQEEVDPDQIREEMHEKLQNKIREGLREEEAPKKTPDPEASSRNVPESDIIQDYQEGGKQSSTSRSNSSEDTKKKVSQSENQVYQGKYTIQLASYRSRKDAEEFARGFTIRGYDPIINEVDIPGRGTWYRVSLGIFNTSTEAKDYIKSEEELFQGQDYVIGRFD